MRSQVGVVLHNDSFIPSFGDVFLRLQSLEFSW